MLPLMYASFTTEAGAVEPVRIRAAEGESEEEEDDDDDEDDGDEDGLIDDEPIDSGAEACAGHMHTAAQVRLPPAPHCTRFQTDSDH